MSPLPPITTIFMMILQVLCRSEANRSQAMTGQHIDS
jgi:hypothetical protein